MPKKEAMRGFLEAQNTQKPWKNGGERDFVVGGSHVAQKTVISPHFQPTNALSRIYKGFI